MKRFLISTAIVLGTFLGSFGLAHALSVFQFIQGGTGATSFAPSSVITSNSGGTALIATGTQLTVGNILATTTATSTFTGGIKTNLLNVISTTASSTFSNGIVLTNGCIQVNGTCTVAGGTVTSIVTNNGLTGGPITTTGTIGLAAIAANNVLANGTGASAVPSAVATSTFFGANTDGRILAQLNGAIGWAATTTFNSPLTYSAGSVSCATCNTSNASVSSIATNNGLTGGTITTTGTIGLAAIAANNVLANGTGASGVPSAVATSTFFGLGTNGQILAQSGGTIGWVSTTTAGTGLAYTAGSPGNFSVNTSQNISTLSNLTNNGFVITSGGTGALSIQQFPATVAEGGTNKTSYPINSIITSDSAGTSLIATTSQLTTGSLLATSTLSNSFFLNSYIGFGTSSAQYLVTVASSTGPQLVFSAGANVNMWAMRTLSNGDLAFATTTVVGSATTSTSALILKTSGVPSVTVGTTTCMTTLKNGSLCLGGGGDAQGNTGSTTISASKLQFDITDRLGARTCAFFNGTAIVVVVGACTP